jgi:hypothetical protein
MAGRLLIRLRVMIGPSFPSNGNLVRQGATLIVPSSLTASLYQTVGCLAGAVGFGVFGWRSHFSGDWIYMVLGHFLLVLAPVMLICAIQSLVWAVRRLPDVIVHERGVTTFLTGFRSIDLAAAEVASLLIYCRPEIGVSLAIEPADSEKFRRELSLMDRYYFDQSRKYVGHGLSLTLRLNAEELAEFYARLRAQYGERAKSELH